MSTAIPRAISMRDLQKMSAAQIEAMPGPVPVRSGDRTLALLVPLRRPDVAALDALAAEVAADVASRSVQEQAAIDAFLAARGEA